MKDICLHIGFNGLSIGHKNISELREQQPVLKPNRLPIGISAGVAICSGIREYGKVDLHGANGPTESKRPR
jgi:hypothetical protein